MNTVNWISTACSIVGAVCLLAASLAISASVTYWAVGYAINRSKWVYYFMRFYWCRKEFEQWRAEKKQSNAGDERLSSGTRRQRNSEPLETMPEENTTELASGGGLSSTGLFCRRWNFENRGGEIWVCKDEHDKGQPCEYEEMFAADALKLIEELRAIILKQNSQDQG